MDDTGCKEQNIEYPDEKEIQKLLEKAERQFTRFRGRYTRLQRAFTGFINERQINDNPPVSQEKGQDDTDNVENSEPRTSCVKTKPEIEERIGLFKKTLYEHHKGIYAFFQSRWTQRRLRKHLHTTVNSRKIQSRKELTILKEESDNIFKNEELINSSLSKRHELILDYISSPELSLMADLALLDEGRESEMDKLVKDSELLKKLTDRGIEFMVSHSIVPEDAEEEELEQD